ncbi:MAG: hypothetical protein LBI53_01410 [Candidatus Peribacteria bacterium]|jgi:hypothetical protein|nr:hypothetical protein [Candidatus Peribacteria bacterium]
MSNATSSNAQQLFDRMDFKKLKPLNSSLKDIAEDLREQLKNEFDLKNLSYEDRKDLRKGVEKIIKDTEGLSEMDKKRYFVLLQELTFHYPPQEKLTKINEKRLTLRDQLAENLKTNRDENWNNHVNIGFPV